VTEIALDAARRMFARQMVGLTGAANERLEAAFATVPRERFLGAEPWQVRFGAAGFVSLPSNDPVYAYQDVLIALDAKRGVNNGSPSLHARLLHALDPRPGGVICHIGAGTGYYSAILAALVGPTGRVTAVEYDEALANQARANLAHLPNVDVIHGDGSLWPQSEVDAIYVNFAVERPAAAWIEQLHPQGQLMFPFGVAGRTASPGGPRHTRQGAVFVMTKGEDQHPARMVCPASFVCAEGDLQASSDERQKLAAAFSGGGAEFVQSLIWGRPIDPARCWYAATDWAFSYEPGRTPAP
jgi:protein-L-isoaspartate(D-aspartate) O-methyltransferase